MDASTPSPSPPSSSWDPGKLFVGGISWDTGSTALRDHFGKYGEVTEAVAVKDRITGNPRGFAFVLFSDPDSAERALCDKDRHTILGRTVELKRARSRNHNHYQRKGPIRTGASNSSSNSSSLNPTKSKKIFVGGLSSDVTADVFRAYFGKFGTVSDVVVIYDSNTHRSRGFGFVEFEKEEAVEEVMRTARHEVNNKAVEVKIAVPKDGNGNGANRRTGGDSSGNNYNSRVDGAVGYGFGNYPGGFYPAYGPRYGYSYMYPPPAVPGYGYGGAGYGGGYGFGGYGRFGYGAQFGSPSGQWNDQGMVAARPSPMPYGNTTMYPGYPNGGFGGYMGAPAAGYQGVVSDNDKLNPSGSDAHKTSGSDDITSRVENLKLDTR